MGKMKKPTAFSTEALIFVLVLCAVVKKVSGGSKEIMAVADTYMENSVIRTGGLSSEFVSSSGECSILCLATNSCVSFYYNSISRECLPQSTIHQPSDTSVTELNWTYFITIDNSDTWWHFQGHKYYFPPNIVRTWEGAKAFCKNIGSYLVQIETQEEQTWVSSQLENSVWTGLNDFAVQGQYVWGDSGAVPTFYNWDINEPNFADERCVAMLLLGVAGPWHDAPCDFTLNVICEK